MLRCARVCSRVFTANNEQRTERREERGEKHFIQTRCKQSLANIHPAGRPAASVRCTRSVEKECLVLINAEAPTPSVTRKGREYIRGLTHGNLPKRQKVAALQCRVLGASSRAKLAPLPRPPSSPKLPHGTAGDKEGRPQPLSESAIAARKMAREKPLSEVGHGATSQTSGPNCMHPACTLYVQTERETWSPPRCFQTPLISRKGPRGERGRIVKFIKVARDH